MNKQLPPLISSEEIHLPENEVWSDEEDSIEERLKEAEFLYEGATGSEEEATKVEETDTGMDRYRHSFQLNEESNHHTEAMVDVEDTDEGANEGHLIDEEDSDTVDREEEDTQNTPRETTSDRPSTASSISTQERMRHIEAADAMMKATFRKRSECGDIYWLTSAQKPTPPFQKTNISMNRHWFCGESGDGGRYLRRDDASCIISEQQIEIQVNSEFIKGKIITKKGGDHSPQLLWLFDASIAQRFSRSFSFLAPQFPSALAEVAPLLSPRRRRCVPSETTKDHSPSRPRSTPLHHSSNTFDRDIHSFERPQSAQSFRSTVSEVESLKSHIQQMQDEMRYMRESFENTLKTLETRRPHIAVHPSLHLRNHVSSENISGSSSGRDGGPGPGELAETPTSEPLYKWILEDSHKTYELSRPRDLSLPQNVE
ncbi:hypothetical protein PROFUN_01575 [Planoprotostelium fungivorum]|uniref:Uncharacterized protein n=1 Tax=Planoprotostelium fungivorum TaxID=1890364 RepID=A0A2P6NTL3_9EUKA|nr:hypothetical protein PROFUN_01575 [Planoprotostelium fungivorum]